MEKYDKLVKALRERARRENEWYEHGGDIIEDAAAAIEELQAIAHSHCVAASAYWDELEELKAQLPKRGEWIHSAVVEGTTAGGITITHTYTCSVCGALLGRKGDKYCYNCGSRNEVEKPEPPKEDV